MAFPLIIGTGLTSMVGSRFTELYAQEFSFENLDLATGVDITNEGLVKEKISESNGDVVIHFAAFTDVSRAHEQNGDTEGLCYRLNVLGTRHVALSCKASGKYLIHVSTDFVFDGENPPEGGYTETDTPHPLEWYGKTKLWAEEEIKQSGANSVIVRIAYPYRANFPAKLDLVRSLIKNIKQGKLYPLFTDHIITPTFIDDIARVLRAVIHKRPQGIFHTVGSTSISDYELALAIATVFNLDKSVIKPGSLQEFLKTAKRPYEKNLALSNSKLKQELGLSMATIPEGLKAIKAQMGQ